MSRLAVTLGYVRSLDADTRPIPTRASVSTTLSPGPLAQPDAEERLRPHHSPAFFLREGRFLRLPRDPRGRPIVLFAGELAPTEVLSGTVTLFDETSPLAGLGGRPAGTLTLQLDAGQLRVGRSAQVIRRRLRPSQGTAMVEVELFLTRMEPDLLPAAR